jgi:hypothetical protein
VALTFNGVTDKKSSSILIYYIKGTDIYTEMGGVIKIKGNEVFNKNRAFLIREGAF